MSTRPGDGSPGGPAEIADSPLRASLPDPGSQRCKRDAAGDGTLVAAAWVADGPDAITLLWPSRRRAGRHAPGRATRGLLADREDHRPFSRVAGDGDAAGGDRRSPPAVLQPEPRIRHPHRL